MLRQFSPRYTSGEFEGEHADQQEPCEDHDPAVELCAAGVSQCQQEYEGHDPANGFDRVFERFRRGSTSTGSGLGLTISRDLVEAHGGTIAMSSTPGRDTAVIVTLRLVEVSAQRLRAVVPRPICIQVSASAATRPG
jgi:phosphoglycerate-specific signal transduction histidine kinase